MTSIFDVWGTDAVLETAGVWIDYGAAGKFLVARSGGANTKFAKVLEAKMRPYRRQLDQGKLDNEVASKVLLETFIEACLLGWENITYQDGKAVKFSKQNAVKLFTDLPDLFGDLRDQSSKMATFQQEEIEADSGN